ncbi:hypothetical protein SMICM17S_08466 [Streptomyces microflavus]
MDINEWWGWSDGLGEAAGYWVDDRDLPHDPLPGALPTRSPPWTAAEIIDFAVTAYEVTASAYRWPLGRGLPHRGRLR